MPTAQCVVKRDPVTRGDEIALDDFGTGHSKLQHLHRFPVDVVKVPRPFVKDLAADPVSRAIVAGVVSMTRGMDVELIAEGIETPAQAEVLRGLGYRLGQGYLFSRLVEADAAQDMLAATAPARRPGRIRRPAFRLGFRRTLATA